MVEVEVKEEEEEGRRRGGSAGSLVEAGESRVVFFLLGRFIVLGQISLRGSREGGGGEV